MLTSLAALESVEFEVFPGADLYGAMGKVEGSAPVTNRAKAPWYIKSMVAVPVGRPEALIDPPALFDPAPCDPEAFRTWIHMVHVNPSSTTNTEMIIKFKGTLITCTEGSGGSGGSVPEFESTIVHADLDVDSDNNSTGFQKPPHSDDAEDNMEETAPGVYLCVNRNRDESGGGIDGPEDFERDGIDPSDGDLVRARLTIKPKAGRATFTYSTPNIRLYRDNGELLRSGVAYAFGVGEHVLLMEGIAVGTGSIDMVFQPEKAQGQVYDAVQYTVLDVRLVSAADFYLADSEAWFPYRFLIEGLKADDVVTIDAGQVEYWVGGERKMAPDILGQPVITTDLRAPFPRNSRTNGQSQDYLGVINQVLFDDIVTQGRVVDSGAVILRNVSFRVNGTKTVGRGGSNAVTGLYFGDRTIEAVEPGKTEDIDMFKDATRQRGLIRDPDLRMLRMSSSPPTPLPLDQTPLGWDVHQVDFPFGGESGHELTAQLSYERFFLPGVIANTQIQILDKQDGRYFVVCYNQVAAGISGFGVAVVGQAPLSSGSAALFEGSRVVIRAINEKGVINPRLVRQINFAQSMLGEATAWIPLSHPLVSSLQDYAAKAMQILELASPPPRPDEFLQAGVLAAFGRVEDVRSPAPESIGPRWILAEVNVGRFDTEANQTFSGTLAGQVFSRDQITDTAWPVGSMFQGTVTSSLALRARAGRFGFRNAFITIGVQYGDARLRMRWASLMGPQSQRVFGE